MINYKESLNKEQYEAVTTDGPVLIIAGAGSGKALVNGTCVKTLQGDIPIETLNKGDLVFGTDGDVYPVTGVYPQGKKKVCEIEFEDGNIIRCCEDHLWSYLEDGELKTAKTKELFEEEVLLPVCKPVDYPRRQMAVDPQKLGSFVGENLLSPRFITGNYAKTDIKSRKELIDALLFSCHVKGTIYSKVFTEDPSRIKEIAESLGMLSSIKEDTLSGETIYLLTVDKKPEGRRIKEIRQTKRSLPMTCISVDSPDHLFLTEHYIVTHNTTVLSYRTAYLLEQGNANILLLSFTNKAAGELKKRAEKMLGQSTKRVTACTYHSFCNMVLRKYAFRIGLKNNYTILDMSDTADAVTLAKTKLGLDKRKDLNSSAIASADSYAKNKGLTIEEALDSQSKLKDCDVYTICQILEEVEKYKTEHNMLNFDDLLLKTIQLFKEDEFVRSSVERRYTHIMVDEYQDSNMLQEEMTFLIRRKNKNLCVVGDDAQCIYGFRGSCVENIRAFPDKMEGTKVIYLNQNYRSFQEILNFSNNFMKVYDKKGFRKQLMAFRGTSGLKPEIVYPETVGEEAGFVADRIMQELRGGMEPNEICVLFRNASHSYILESELLHRRIPYEKRGGLKFFEKKHIKNLLAYYKVTANPLDELSWFRIYNSLKGIGAKTAREYAMLRGTGEKPLGRSKASISSINMLDDFLEEFEQSDFEEMSDLLLPFYFKTQNEVYEASRANPQAKQKLSSEIESAQDDADTLKEIAKSFKSLPEFLENISLNGVEEESENKVVLSTIHSAKGLEFKIVFVISCTEGLFPSGRYKEDEDEELRCFYVATTRAKDKLILSCPQTVTINGEYQEGSVSRFIVGSEEFLDNANTRRIKSRWSA